jgi:alkanesulfonate monooxygenase SsuD/methylene tetrahydromethanopterin reductase-like flavin-dependent oxidoreductase (luciferase family)
MTKERINVTVDPDVCRQLKERDDINVSGAVNQYLKRRLAGEDKDDAMLKIEIERHEEQAEKYEERAQQERQKAETKRRKLRDRKEKRREELQTAIQKLEVSELSSGPFVTTPDERVETIASELDIGPDELREAAIEAHEAEA